MTDSRPITLRPAQESDLAQVANLDRLAFSPLTANTSIETEWYGGTLNLPGRTLFLAIASESGSAIGTYAQLDLGIWFEGQAFPAMGIAGVAVAPHRRGQQVARLMLEHALAAGQRQNLPLMALYPFQHGFYRRLGWAWVGQTRQYSVSTRDLPLYPERSPILPYNPPLHQERLKQVYAEAATQHNGWLQRRDWQWLPTLKPVPGKEIYVYPEGDQLSGYVIFQFVELESANNSLGIVVSEWVALTATAYRGILGFLASLRDQISTVIWNTYPDDPFPHLLKEQRHSPALVSSPFRFGLTHRFGAIGGGFMWRLVDLKRAFELRSLPPGEPFTLTLQVTDPILGDQTITAEFANGRMIWREAPVLAVLKTSIDHLTELFCGVRRATELAWTGELEFVGSPVLLTQLDAAWQAQSPFCWDFF